MWCSCVCVVRPLLFVGELGARSDPIDRTHASGICVAGSNHVCGPIF